MHVKPRFYVLLHVFMLCLFAKLLFSILVNIFYTRPNMDAAIRDGVKWAVLVQHCKTLKWQRPPAKKVTALVSHPGSGNTWLRELLQRSTGSSQKSWYFVKRAMFLESIATGSVYFDDALKLTEFPGEHVSDGSVLVVKTHETSDCTKFQKAVVLVRNPRDALLAEFNRHVSKHHEAEAATHFFKEKGWVNYFEYSIRSWEKLYSVWLTHFEGPLHVVHYEELLNNTEPVLQKLLEFLGQEVSEADIRCAVQSNAIFKRTHKITFDPFTPEMYKIMNDARNKILNIMQTRLHISSSSQLSVKVNGINYLILIIIANVISLHIIKL